MQQPSEPVKQHSVVGTLTFQDALNYGAILQCYALQQAIIREGYETEVINYASDAIRAINWPCGVSSKSTPKKLIKGLVKRPYLKKRKASFDAFKKEALLLSSECYKENFTDAVRRYSKVIVGSDQVWNPTITRGDLTYYLGSIHEASKKASYAASIGLREVPRQYVSEISAALSEMGYITVREETAASVIAELTGRQVPVVCDPVMLLNKEEWADLMAPDAGVGRDYFLYYSLGMPNRRHLELARNYANEHGLALVVLHNSPLRISGCISDNSCDPRLWLSFIHGASFIMTSSFHGVCFSLLFGKEFRCVPNERNASVSSRIDDLLSRYSLKELMSDGTIDESIPPIKWSNIKKTLDAERENGIFALRNMLEWGEE